MPTDLPRFEGNERVDKTDFDVVVDESPQALVRQLNEQFLTDPDASAADKSWILDGFAMSDLGGGQLKVTKGRALLAQREGSEIHYGALTTEGDASKTIDLSGYANNTYKVFIRFQYVDSETQSRMFWNPSGSSEFAQSMYTRRQANWSLRVELASPGSEWFQIGTVQIVAGVIGGAGIVDMRDFYFEGDVSATYANTWGSGTDRNANRATYGVKDIQTFTAAVRQLFEELRPPGTRWWEVSRLYGVGPTGTNDPGVDGVADGSGPGVKGTASGEHNSSVGVHGYGDVSGAATTSDGVHGTGAGTDGHGVVGTGAGTGPGVKGTASGASNSSVGLEGVGDVSGAATTSDGVHGTGAGTDGHGVVGVGAGTGPGVQGTASGANNSSAGLEGVGNVSGAATSSEGVLGTGAGAGAGVKGIGGATGKGLYGVATVNYGVHGESSASHGVVAQGDTTSPNRSAFRIVPQDAAPTTGSVGDIYVTVAGIPYVCTDPAPVWTKISAT